MTRRSNQPPGGRRSRKSQPEEDEREGEDDDDDEDGDGVESLGVAGEGRESDSDREGSFALADDTKLVEKYRRKGGSRVTFIIV